MNNNNLLDVLTRQGVLISVNIRFWRAQKKLTAQDIGIDPDDVTERLISLGHKRLLPKEALAPFALIESRAHAINVMKPDTLRKAIRRRSSNALVSLESVSSAWPPERM